MDKYISREEAFNLLKKYNQDLSVRAEQITIETFVDIANNL